jgi:hypothetical protein
LRAIEVPGTAEFLRPLRYRAMGSLWRLGAVEPTRALERCRVALNRSAKRPPTNALPPRSQVTLATATGPVPSRTMLRLIVDPPGGGEEELGLPRLSKPYRLEHLAAALATTVGPVSAYRNVIPLRAG